jgi:ribosome recycling factor
MAKSYDEITMECEEAMEKVVGHLKHEFLAISAGKATPALVENIRFEYYGTPTPVKQAAQINVADALTVTIKPFDLSQIKAISRAIVDAKVGLNPTDDGKLIYCRVPQLTQENRQRLAKQVKDIAEKEKVGIRNARHEAIKHADASLKEAALTEDDHRNIKEEIQKLTDTYNKQIEEVLKKKTDDIMKV